MEFKISATSFKKIDNPSTGEQRQRYIFLAKVADLQKSGRLSEWMKTNPREQNIDTNVAKAIKTSLESCSTKFHELNRGILFSAENVSYNNKKNIVSISFSNETIHGNIDGGHTLKIILDENNFFSDDKYVFVEVIVGLYRESVIELAEARNTSVQVDILSIEELREAFQPIKYILGEEQWFERVKWKQNQTAHPIVRTIDGRIVISLFDIFIQEITPTGAKHQPVYTYSSKQSSLKKFKKWKDDTNNYADFLWENKIFFIEIFNLFEEIQKFLPQEINKSGKKYGSMPFAGEKNQSVTYFNSFQTLYFVPGAIVYPILSAFRANVAYEEGKLSWIIPINNIIESTKNDIARYVSQELETLAKNPNQFGKKASVWENLYRIVKLEVIERKEA